MGGEGFYSRNNLSGGLRHDPVPYELNPVPFFLVLPVEMVDEGK
jgi:hypothetical protein